MQSFDMSPGFYRPKLDKRSASQAVAAEFRLSFELTNIRINVLLPGGASLRFEVDKMAKQGSEQVTDTLESLSVTRILLMIVKPGGTWSVLDISKLYLKKSFELLQ
jgi:hypothetical protein